MIRRTWMCLSVRGALRDLNTSRSKKSHFTDSAGVALTKLQAIDSLQDELVKGREVIPLSKLCDSPCKRSDKCSGFDYAGNGCPGISCENGSPA